MRIHIGRILDQGWGIHLVMRRDLLQHDVSSNITIMGMNRRCG